MFPETMKLLCSDHNGSMLVRQLLEKRKDTANYPAFRSAVSETVLTHLPELLPHKNGHTVVLSALKHLPEAERDAIVNKLLSFTNAKGYLATPLSIFAKHEHAGRVVKYVLEHGSLGEMAAMRIAVDDMGVVSSVTSE